jgi:glycosyltransferase involved in cell wall biosynthesis
VGDVRAIAGGTGDVVPPKNPEALCAAWQRLRARLTREPALGEAARGIIVSNYSLEIMVRRTEDVLSQLVAERPPQELVREFA